MMTHSHTISSHHRIRSSTIVGSLCSSSGKHKIVLIAAHFWENIPWEFPGCCNVLMARIDIMTHYLDCPWLIISRGDNRNWTVARCLPVLLTVHWKYIVVIGWSSLLLKITWGVAVFLTAVFLAVVLLDHVQHALLKGLSTQRVWHCACAYPLPSRE